ncbi:carbohydrate ABC transporter permease [Nocardioides sp. C4-1]|uniref:carbohydrate ABC transporter permease n=1 Tax=Nocardioides sp. C4-1 TaxID=3151851 RepID=UPI003265CEE8
MSATTTSRPLGRDGSATGRATATKRRSKRGGKPGSTSGGAASRGSRSSRVASNVVGLGLVVLFVFPVYWMISTSFRPRRDINGPEPVWHPFGGTLDNYRRIFEDGRFLDSMRISLTVTVATVAIAIVFAFLAAVALSRFRFRGRTSFVVALLVVQMVPAEGLFISQYKMLDGAGFTNTVGGLTLLYVAAVLPFTIWVLRGFVNGLPAELEEAAMIDGCSRLGAFFRITFPLLAPGLVATGVFAFIQSWNEFTLALVTMTSDEKKTLPVWLTTFSDVNRGTDWGAIMAGSTLIAIPVIIFFMIVQGRMVAGLTSGAVKG